MRTTPASGPSVDFSERAPSGRMDRRGLALLCTAHLTDDIYQSALPVMLPLFVAAHDLSYSAAAGLMLALMLSSSVVQPFLGQLSDRHPSPWLVPAGLLCAGGGVALATFMPTYPLIVLAIGLSGLGMAAFHPEAARFVNRTSGPRRATGMSLFSLGGTVGLAVGPLLATPLLIAFGLRGAAVLFVPTAVMALLLALDLSRYGAPPQAPAGGKAVRRPGGDAWRPFLLLLGAVLSRSATMYGLNTFIPLYWQDNLHQPISAGGVALTVLFASGAVGALAGGWAADRYGRRPVVIVGLAVLPGLLAVFASVQDATVATLLIAPIGIGLFAPGAVMVVMGQEYLPNRIGIASGVTLGLSATAGGLIAPLLGQVADVHGLQSVLYVITAIPLLGVACGLLLPERVRGRGYSATP